MLGLYVVNVECLSISLTLIAEVNNSTIRFFQLEMMEAPNTLRLCDIIWSYGVKIQNANDKCVHMLKSGGYGIIISSHLIKAFIEFYNIEKLILYLYKFQGD